MDVYRAAGLALIYSFAKVVLTGKKMKAVTAGLGKVITPKEWPLSFSIRKEHKKTQHEIQHGLSYHLAKVLKAA